MKIDNRIINIDNNNDFKECVILLEKIYKNNREEKELFGEEESDNVPIEQTVEQPIEQPIEQDNVSSSFEDEVNLDDIEF